MSSSCDWKAATAALKDCITNFPSASSAILYAFCGGFGITAGAHRLFAHKAYKANTPLKLLLILFQTIAFQNSVFEWARDHR
jgi:fatty-acid desaturase